MIPLALYQGPLPIRSRALTGRRGLAALGAEISAPGAIARAGGARQTLALGVGAGEAAEIATMCGARDKETQRKLRFLALGQNSGRTQSDGRDCGKNDVSMGHDVSPCSSVLYSPTTRYGPDGSPPDSPV